MAVKIIVPNKAYTERYFGLDFIKGVAVCEDEAKAKRIAGALGYKLEPVVEAVAEPVEEVKAKPKARAKKAPAKSTAKKE